MITCKRCGKCCYLAGVQPCKFLVFHDGGVTSCRIYRHRLGKKIADGFKCFERKDLLVDFIGCPYNTNKPIRELIK